MAHTHLYLLYHVVFSTKGRERQLSKEVRERLFPYMAGIFGKLGGNALLINGTLDHVHVLCRLRASMSLSKVVQTVKANSSAWAHGALRKPGLRWQDGYGAFTVSASQCERVRDYIAGQKEHHTKQGFKEEYLALLRKHEIEYDERFVWD